MKPVKDEIDDHAVYKLEDRLLDSLSPSIFNYIVCNLTMVVKLRTGIQKGELK